jgi:hypothetical protein
MHLFAIRVEHSLDVPVERPERRAVIEGPAELIRAPYKQHASPCILSRGTITTPLRQRNPRGDRHEPKEDQQQVHFHRISIPSALRRRIRRLRWDILKRVFHSSRFRFRLSQCAAFRLDIAVTLRVLMIHCLRIEAAKLSFVSIYRSGVSSRCSPEGAPLKTCSRKQMHKIVEYPCRADTAHQIAISLELILLQMPHLKSLLFMIVSILPPLFSDVRVIRFRGRPR